MWAEWNQLRAEQPIMSPKPAVEISYTQIGQHFRLWIDKNSWKEQIEAKCSREVPYRRDEPQRISSCTAANKQAEHLTV